MSWFSIIFFFAVTITTGTLVDLLVRGWSADWFEKLVMRFGAGLAALSVIGVILNLLHIPLDYRVFSGIGILILIGAVFRCRAASTGKKNEANQALSQFWLQKKFWYGLFMLVLFGLTLHMYLEGSFRYDYFEDTDPWGYTAVADYIGENKTFSVPYYSLQYSEPYTQGYQIVMGLVSQTNDSIYWTMKFFNALIVSFGVLFMYFFARRFSGDEDVAVLAGFFLFAVPAWVSHFVFSLHFNMTIFVVLLYVLAQLTTGHRSDQSSIGHQPGDASSEEPLHHNRQEGQGWVWVGIIVYASMLVNHFSTSIHGTLFCLVFIVTRSLAEKRLDWRPLSLMAGGFILSLLYFIPAYTKHWWLTGTTEQLGGIRALFPVMRFLATPFGVVAIVGVVVVAVLTWRSRKRWQPSLEVWIGSGNRGLLLWSCGLVLVMAVLLLPLELTQTVGTGDRFYTLEDFFSASTNNMMNNPIGLGPVLMSAVLVSFLLATIRIKSLFEPDQAWIAASYAWLISSLLLVLGKYFSISIAPFRVWTFLGLFASLFAAWGVVATIRNLSKSNWLMYVALFLLAAMTVPSTFLPKRQVNTMVWQDHTIGVPESHELFVWMRNGGIPKNSVVAHLCGSSEFLSGYDMDPPSWDEVFHPARSVDAPYFVKYPINLSADAMSVLRNADVEYVTLGASCLWQAPVPVEREEAYGNFIRKKMDEYLADRRLTLIKSTGLELLFKIN